MPSPYPLLGARAALAFMKRGDILRLMLTDLDSVLGVPAWCRMTGNPLLGVVERAGVHCVLVQKGGPSRRSLRGGPASNDLFRHGSLTGHP